MKPTITKDKTKDMTSGYEALFGDRGAKEIPAVLHYEDQKTETPKISHVSNMSIEEIETKKPVEKAKKEVTEYNSRVTLLTSKEIHKKIKIMAHHELTTLTDIINSALKKTITQYEKSHGELISVPKSKI